MVKKIKKKIKIKPGTRFVIPLAMAVSVQFQPARGKPFLFSRFSNPGLMTGFFQDHFSLEIVAADRFVSAMEFGRWLGAARPQDVMKEGLKMGHLEFPEFSPVAGPSDLALLPLLGIGTEKEWETQTEQWMEGFSEIQTTVFRRMVESEVGAVPGVDKCQWMGPCSIKEINQVILYLHGRMAEACRTSGWPAPPLFPILDFKSLEGRLSRYPVSY